MSTPNASQILFALGGRTLTQHGTVPWRKGLASRGGGIAYTETRADASTCANLIDYDGLIRLSLANLLRIEWVDLDGDGVLETPGLSLKGSRTNIVLFNRDLTNAAWVKTTMTAAKDQTGVDGVANSASSLLATAGNATALQAITIGSQQRAQASWVKRLVGSGVVQMTMDNGATWTAITLTTSWTRVTIPSQTLANPTVGFRLVTNADKIAVDYVQNEAAAFQSSAIATGAVSVTRAADSLTVPFNFGPFDTTVLVRSNRPAWVGINPVSIPNYMELSTSGNKDFRIFTTDGTNIVAGVRDDAANDLQGSTAIPAGTQLTFCAQLQNASTGPKVRIDAGSGFSSFSATGSKLSAYGNQTLRIGSGLYGVLIDLIIAKGLYT